MARRRPSRSTGSDPGASDSPEASFDAAVRHLARAPRTAHELSRYLAARGVAPATAEATLDAVRARGWLDDAAVAQRRAEDLLLRRGFGRLRVAHELTLRGLTDSVIDAAIAAALAETSEAELAQRALRRKVGGTLPASGADRARAQRFLVGRGHPAEIVSALLEEDG
jgi:regulatory protein